jgi:hypothetical protein
LALRPPYGQISDVLEGTDTSERFKHDNLRDTLMRLKAGGLIADSVEVDDASIAQAAAALEGGELLSVIE